MRKWRRLVNHGRRASKNEEKNKKKKENEKQIRKRRQAVPKLLKITVFRCKRMGLRMPKSKNGDHFLSPAIPKNGVTDFSFT